MRNSLTRIMAQLVNKFLPFRDSQSYWDMRYKAGGYSGAGSHGKFARFKAQVINDYVELQDIKTVVEFGCGDGNQLALSNYPQYSGFDISAEAIRICNNMFLNDASKKFFNLNEYTDHKAELTLSLDVIYHLIEDDVFEDYMVRLFSASNKHVIIYSSNSEEPSSVPHIKHRLVTTWVEQNITNFHLEKHIPNMYPFSGDHIEGSFADFYIYIKK